MEPPALHVANRESAYRAGSGTKVSTPRITIHGSQLPSPATMPASSDKKPTIYRCEAMAPARSLQQHWSCRRRVACDERNKQHGERRTEVWCQLICADSARHFVTAAVANSKTRCPLFVQLICSPRYRWRSVRAEVVHAELMESNAMNLNGVIRQKRQTMLYHTYGKVFRSRGPRRCQRRTLGNAGNHHWNLYQAHHVAV